MTKYIHQNPGANRRERRHFTDVNGKKHNIPKRWQAPPENEPYVKPEVAMNPDKVNDDNIELDEIDKW